MLSATVVIVAARSRLWGILPGWLQALILRFRLVRYTLAALPLFLFGLGIYVIEVSGLDANMYYVRPINWFVLTSVGFVVNRAIFNDRQAPKYRSGVKFYGAAVACSLVSNSLFVWLHMSIGLYYLLAQVVAGLAVGVLHYLTLNRGVFLTSKTATA